MEQVIGQESTFIHFFYVISDLLAISSWPLLPISIDILNSCVSHCGSSLRKITSELAHSGDTPRPLRRGSSVLLVILSWTRNALLARRMED